MDHIVLVLMLRGCIQQLSEPFKKSTTTQSAELRRTSSLCAKFILDDNVKQTDNNLYLFLANSGNSFTEYTIYES